MVNQLQLTNNLLSQHFSPCIFGGKEQSSPCIFRGKRMVNQLQLTNNLLLQLSSPCIFFWGGGEDGLLATTDQQSTFTTFQSLHFWGERGRGGMSTDQTRSEPSPNMLQYPFISVLHKINVILEKFPVVANFHTNRVFFQGVQRSNTGP